MVIHFDENAGHSKGCLRPRHDGQKKPLIPYTVRSSYSFHEPAEYEEEQWYDGIGILEDGKN
jgi:hypothetical protein